MQSSQTPKNFFIQIGIFAALYTSAISFLVFLFSVIDDVFPNTLDYYSDSGSGIRFSISTLIVVFPLFIWLSRLYRKFVKDSPEFAESKLRKWITYLTLFVTGATIAIDAIVLVNTFLAGESLTVGFLLKVLSVLIVAGAIFTFCLKDLKGYFDQDQKRSKVWAAVVSTIVLLSIIFGFVLIGSPSKQRDMNFDSQRISDLSDIQYQVVYYYQQKGVLPTELAVLRDPLSGNVIPKDPESANDYAYSVTDKLSFKLCADFKTDSKTVPVKAMYPESMSENWQHRAETTCFDRTIDPEKYPRVK